MPESVRRVVLLARPGAARDRLRSALAEVGADLALEADPTKVGSDELAAARPEVVIVALDGATEAALERLDAVLQDPAIDVMYEEAELAANRSGWDAARWLRHLAAKLNRHDDVLPPGAANDDMVADSAVAQSAAPSVGLGVEQRNDEADAGASLAAAALPEAPAVEVPVAHPLSEEFTSGIDSSGFTSFDPVAAEIAEAEDAADQIITFGSGLGDEFRLDGDANAEAASPSALPTLDLVFDSEITLPVGAAPATGIDPGDFTLDAAGVDIEAEPGLHALLPDPAVEVAGNPQSHEDAGLDFDVLSFDPVAAEEPASQVRTASATDFGALSFDPVMAEAAEPQGTPTPDPALSPGAPVGAPAPAPSFAGLSSGHVLELVSNDAAPIGGAPQGLGSARRAPDLDEIQRRISTLELVDVAPEPAHATTAAPAGAPIASAAGAVLLVAGIGGPDAVRQLLGALPEDFPRPVLVQQRLDGGRYDRLVTQMQRATRLPVELAQPGAPLRPGVVYVLPAEAGLESGTDGLAFDGGGGVLDVLPPADSAVVLLSGSDQQLVDRLVEPDWTDGFVAGQASDGCYDAAAPNALAAHGRPTATPTELAQRLTQRWSAA